MNIDEQLQAALDVEPSPAFVARVRTRIANEPAPRRWTAWWMVSAAALAAAALAFGVVVSRPSTIASETPVLATRSLQPIEVPNVLRRLEPARPPIARAAASPVRLHAIAGANVLIDRAESSALRRMVFGPPLNIQTPYVGTTLTAIDIAPIAIEPLPIGSEGVRQ